MTAFRRTASNRTASNRTASNRTASNRTASNGTAPNTIASNDATVNDATSNDTTTDSAAFTRAAFTRTAFTRTDFTRAGMTLREAGALFSRHRNARILTGTTVAAALSRAVLGKWTRRDAVAAAAIVASEPFVEWLVHVHVLHRRPRPARDGGVADSLLASSHRAHHRDPRDPDLVFIPRPALVPAIAALGAANLAGARALRPALSGFTTAIALMTGYEWTHFLIHSAYRPQSALYRTIRRTHQLHHFRNENYWFGIITPVSDKVLNTYPSKDDVPVSNTAKELHGAASGKQ